MATRKHTQAALAAPVNQSTHAEQNPCVATSMARDIPGFKIPPGARAVLVFEDGAGGFNSQPVGRNQSVLNIESELLKHLNEQPYSVEWLAVLRDYCDSRIAARNRAKAAASIITPSQIFDWDMTRLAALRGVQS